MANNQLRLRHFWYNGVLAVVGVHSSNKTSIAGLWAENGGGGEWGVCPKVGLYPEFFGIHFTSIL